MQSEILGSELLTGGPLVDTQQGKTENHVFKSYSNQSSIILKLGALKVEVYPFRRFPVHRLSANLCECTYKQGEGGVEIALMQGSRQTNGYQPSDLSNYL